MPTTIDGTTGVDQVQNGIVTNDKIANGAVTVPKLSATGTANNTTFLRGDGSWQTISTTPTTAQVLAATAGASVGAVGTYAWLGVVDDIPRLGNFAPGQTLGGSRLRFAGVRGQSPAFSGGISLVQSISNLISTASPIPSGTWRCMGVAFNNTESPNNSGYTLWLRIS